MKIKDAVSPLDQGEQRSISERKPSQYIKEHFGFDTGNLDQGYDRFNCDKPNRDPVVGSKK